MSLCPINSEYTFTFEGVRADDGGSPEELFITITRYGSSGTFSAETYDTRVDTDFTFITYFDGTYNYKITGGVSGLLVSQDFLVDFNSRRSVSQLAREDVDDIMCGCCSDDDTYVLVKSLLASAKYLIECGVSGGSGLNITSNDALSKIDLVLKGGCSKKLCGDGC